MYKDRTPAIHQLSYSAVTSHQSGALNPCQFQRYQVRESIQQFSDNYGNSAKKQGNSDLAFLRNTVGPISSLNTDSNYLRVNDNKKIDVSLRQTMDVTSDFKDRLRLGLPNNSKRSSRAETTNQSQVSTRNIRKQSRQDDRLQKIMEKYEKKNQTKQALKLLEELKQLKKKQQQLKKQRKRDTTKDQQTVTNNTRNCHDLSSPVNFSKKNKVEYYTPTYDKKQTWTSGNGPGGQSFFKQRSKKNSYDLTKNNITLKEDVTSYKSQEPIKLLVRNTPIAQNSKPSANLRNYCQNNQPSSTSSSMTSNYLFTKSGKHQDVVDTRQKYGNGGNYQGPADNNYKQYVPLRKYTNQTYPVSYQFNNGNTSNTSNLLSTTTKEKTVDLSKSSNNKHVVPSGPRTANSYTTPELFTSSVSYSTSSKTYSRFQTSSNGNNTLADSKRQRTASSYSPVSGSTNLKDVFAHRNVTINDFVLGKNLGEGKFGTVFQAFDKKTKAIYALKKVPKSIIKSHWMVDQFLLQVKIQNFLNHPNVLTLHGCFDDTENVYILLQYMEQGTLFLHLKKNTTLPQKQAAIKLKQIASAIQYLHQNGIAHRDIKPENIVMSHGVCKLCDFGWATLCDQRRKTYCGTFDYAAPQILQGIQYDMSVDLWCLGILAYQILVGKAPFYHISRKQTMKKIMNCQNQKITYPSTMSYEAKSFIQHLLKKNPEQRLKSQDLVKHAFFRLADS